ncbi:N-acetylglucosaminyltransferase II domain containing protein-like protein, partial [Leptotrombidium deliense]
MKCNSAEFFDKYGNYRETKFTQLQHHWFCYVMLTEDDYYLLPDSLFMFNEMLKLTNDSNCIYSLGFRGLGEEISQT